MEDFAKLFRSDKFGQILALLQNDDSGTPEIRLFFKPKGLGVSQMAFKYKQQERAKKYFDNLKLDKLETGLSAYFLEKTD